MADEAHLIGPAPARDSYLNVERIMAVARQAGAAAIHPGYGFLSERAEFAEACEASGIAFVGPPASAIRAMGLKDAAKALVQQAGVPVVPGYHGARQEPEFLRQKADEIGYPVLIKAIAGGGGKGMRRVEQAADFEAALESAQREATSAFGDARVLVEKYVLSPRHIEIQVFADAPRQRCPSLRAGLLPATPAPESHRGGARAGNDAPKCAPRWERPRSRPRAPWAMWAPGRLSSSPTAAKGSARTDSISWR